MTNIFARMVRRGSSNVVSVPSMDGALKPNRALEDADLVTELPAPDSVVLSKGRLVIASEKRLVEVTLKGGGISVLPSLPVEASYSCTLPDGSFLVGMVGGSITVLDGPFAGQVLQSIGGKPMIASEKGLVEVTLNGGGISVLHSLPAEASCMCTLPDGSFVVGMVGGSIKVLDGPFSGQVIPSLGGKPIVCPTAMHCVDESNIILCIGSSVHGPEQWRRDLLSHGQTGSVWKIDLRSGNGMPLANRLAFPNGVTQTKDGKVIVSESWKHRIVELEPSGKLKVLLEDMPGYPARLAPSEDQSGFWLSVFAPRRPAIELILQEDQFCADMMNGIDEQYWMAPALRSGRDFKEPLLGGAVKHLGIMKPWAPTRSYGLVVRLNSDFQPTSSFHSRGDGNRHGVTDCVEIAGHLYVVSKGGNAVLDIALIAKEIQS